MKNEKRFENLTRSEIKRAEAAANKHYGRNDCKVTGWGTLKTENGWTDVQCEICFDYEERADIDIVVSCCLWDRRRSFAMVWANHTVKNAYSAEKAPEIETEKQEENKMDSMNRKSYSTPETEEYHSATTRAAVAMKWHREGKTVIVRGKRRDGSPYSIEIKPVKKAEESHREKTDRENWKHCKRIAEDVDNYARGNVRRCPECGEEISREEWPDVYRCPKCEYQDDSTSFEDMFISDYLEDIYNIEFRSNGRGPDDYRSIQIMIACGGPNIYLDTASGDVELYWGVDRARYPLSTESIKELDDWAEEYWRCM